jgi:hypothetical protein
VKTLDALAADLGSGGLADAAGMPAAEQSRVRQAIAAAAERGLVAYVVHAEPGRPLAPLRDLWQKLGAKERTDLLLLFNGQRWEAKGWGLSPAQIAAALDGAEPALSEGAGAGLERALERLVAVAAPEAASSSWWGVGAGAGTLALLGVGWVIARRRTLGRERRVRIASARSSVEAVQAEVVLAAEELPAAEAAEVQLRAARLAEEFEAAAQAESEALAVGRLSQLESELNTLHSDVMARVRRERESS